MVFANLDGLFAFNCSAEDAEYLVPELGGAIDEQDLVELGEHQCYARLSSCGKRLPTFSVQLDPPPSGDASRADTLKRVCAERFGRDADLVRADRRAALERIHGARERQHAEPPPTEQPTIPESKPKHSSRNEHRRRKKRTEPEVAIA